MTMKEKFTNKEFKAKIGDEEYTVIVDENGDNSPSAKRIKDGFRQMFDEMKEQGQSIHRYDPKTKKSETLTPNHPEYYDYGRQKD